MSAKRKEVLTLSALIVAACSTSACRTKPPRLPIAPQGVAHARQTDRWIRVRLIRDASDFQLAVKGPHRIYDENLVEIAESDRPLASASVRRAGTTWLIGQHAFAANEIWVVPRFDGMLVVDGRRYRGAVHCLANEGVEAINVVDVESYLLGVLGSELYASFQTEAYRAQAIAARTYALYVKFTEGRQRSFDVTAGESSQVYRGIEAESKKAREAVESTYGQVLAWDDHSKPKLFCAYYSSACGGRTASVGDVMRKPSIPPLAGGVLCQYCRIAPGLFPWPAFELSRTEAASNLSRRISGVKALGTITKISPHKTDSGGRLTELKISGADSRSMVLSANDFRLAVGGHKLKSTLCRITASDKGWRFSEGRGFGHAVGMCQWGAEGMAREGANAYQILGHYYPGGQIVLTY